jgi:hypothetical protein
VHGLDIEQAVFNLALPDKFLYLIGEINELQTFFGMKANFFG